MFTHVQFILAMCCIGALCVGCDGGNSDATGGRPGEANSNGSAEVTTPTWDPESPVADLSDTEYLSLCSESMTMLTQLRSMRDDPQYSCVGEGLYARFGPTSDRLVSTCESARDACLEDAEPYTPPEATVCDDTYLEQAKT